MYSPGVASWNYFRIGEMADPQKLKETLDIHSEVVEEGADGTGAEVRRKFQIPDDQALRRKHFLNENARKEFVFEKGREYRVDFGNPHLGFNGRPTSIALSRPRREMLIKYIPDFSLRLPGFHLNVMKYISERNHKLRYTLKDKKTNKVILAVLLKLLLQDTDEEISERSSFEPECCQGEESQNAKKHEEK